MKGLQIDKEQLQLKFLKDFQNRMDSLQTVNKQKTEQSHFGQITYQDESIYKGEYIIKKQQK